MPLSDRELDVVRLVARGRTNAEISAELFLSLGTVKSHLAKVQSKLHITNRVQIAAWAWEHGQVHEPGSCSSRLTNHRSIRPPHHLLAEASLDRSQEDGRHW